MSTFCFRSNREGVVSHSSRKRKFNDDNQIDVFSTLLIANSEPTNTQQSQEVSQCPTNHQLVTIPPNYTLLSSQLTDKILIGFCTASNDSKQLSLLLWKQQQTDATNMLIFDQSPITVMPHSHKTIEPPSPSVYYSQIPSVCSKIILCSDIDNVFGAACICDVLYSYLFGYENLLSKSSILLYGWICGCILAVPLVRLAISDSSTVICCLEQTVMSISAFTVGSLCDTIGHNSLMFVGSLGNVVLFVAHGSHVKHYELLVPGPILSAMFISNFGLLFSSLDNVKTICLKRDCCTKVERDNFEIFRLFENTLTIIEYPMYLLWHSDNETDVICVTLDGIVIHVDINKSLSTTRLLSPSEAGESVKRSLLSIQSSSNRLDSIQRDINLVDESLVALNETMSLFHKLSINSNNDSINSNDSPFNVHQEIVYEQTGVDEYVPHLEIYLTYNGLRPLRKGVSLIVEAKFDVLTRMEMFVKPRISNGNKGVVFSQTFSLEGLWKGGELRLRPKLSFQPVHSNSTLMVTCWCCYRPQFSDALRNLLQDKCKESVSMVQIIQKNITPLNCVSSLTSSQCSRHCDHSVTINILPSTLSQLTDTTIVSNNGRPLNTTLLSCLISDSQSVQRKIESFTTPVSNVCGHGLELKAVCLTGIILFRLCSKAADSNNGILYCLTISSSSLETPIVLIEEVVQRIVKKVCTILEGSPTESCTVYNRNTFNS